MPAHRTSSSARPASTRTATHVIAWQGWTIVVPDTWNPVKVDGDEADGSLLLADLHAPRLGLRWNTPRPRDDATRLVERALRDEVGALAAEEAVDAALSAAADWSAAKLYRDPAPPGRDVFVGHSLLSGRIVQVVHHAERRSDAFAGVLLPTLTDTPRDTARRVSIFDLSLTLPPATRVRWYRFNAGDLSVGLDVPDAAQRGVTVVRQIGPASLALSRQPLAAWLLPSGSNRKPYRPIADVEPAALVALDGRTLSGVRGTLTRRRRLAWAWMIDRRQTVLAFHDTTRDRLIVGQAADEAVLRQVLATVGSGTLEASS